MSNYAKYLVLRTIGFLFILGAGYGYVTRNPLVLFSCVLVGLGVGVASVYYWAADGHKDQAAVAAETLARLPKSERNRLSFRR